MSNSTPGLELEECRRQALLTGDKTALQGLLAENLIYVHSTGISDTKSSYMNKLSSGVLTYLELQFSNLQVLSLQSTIVVTGRMNARVRKDGHEKDVASLFMTVWSCHTDGAWQLHAHQGTTVAP